LTNLPPIDPERLAALIDGRLSDTDAAAVRAQLALTDDETLASFADAMAVSTELNPPSASSDATPIGGHKRWRWFIPTVVLAAATLMAVVLVRPGRLTGSYLPAELVAAVPVAGSAPAAVWGATRGASPTMSPRARAVRVGARLADFEVEVRRGDTTKAAAREILELLDQVSGASSALAGLRSYTMVSGAALSASQRTALGRQAMELGGPTFAKVGTYLEAARLATAVGDVGFFDRFATETLSPVERDSRLDSSIRSSLQQLEVLVNARPRDAVAIHQAVTQLLLVLTR
jgi:hypothetical protein